VAFPSTARAVAIAVVLLLSMAVAQPCRAQAVHNLERGLPLEVQDTAPTDTGKVSLQMSAVNEPGDSPETSDRFTLQPTIQWGFAENAHLSITSPYYLGDESVQGGSGDIYVGMLYNFLAEGHYMPGVAVLGEVVAPTGVGSDGLDTALTFIASKQINNWPSEDRFDLNIRWDHNSIAGTDERKDRFEYVIGYSRKITDKSVLVLDFFRREELTEKQESNVLEAGILYQLSQRVTVGLGVGTGIGDESPTSRISFSCQWLLGP